MNTRVTADPRKATKISGRDAMQRPIGDRFTRSEKLDGGQFDDAAMGFAAIIATETPVKRSDHKGPYNEIIVPSGLATLLDPHFDVALITDHLPKAENTVGRAHSFKVTDKGVEARLRFSTDATLAPLIARVKDGTLPHLSIGYRVEKWAESIENGVRTKRAVRWHLLEVSIVAIPADRNSRIQRSESEMDTMEEEKTRKAEIRTICRAVGMTADQADELIDEGLDVEAVKARAFQHMQDKPTPRIRVAAPSIDGSDFVRAAGDALCFRMGALDKLPDGSRDFAHTSLLGLATVSLERAGVSVRGMSADEILARSAGTSDFPLVVSNVAGKVSADAYKAAESPLKALCQSRSLSNFKTSTAIRLGEMGRLEPLSEHGEFTATSRAENGETIKLGTFGRRFDVTRQLIIDDDLGLFADITRALGEAAAQTENDAIVSLLTGSATLSDGQPLFHASRSNIGDGTALGDSGAAGKVLAAITAMKKTKGLDGKTIIDAAPKYLIVGPDAEFDGERLLADIYAANTADVNVLRKKLELVVEPRIEGDNWILLSDPARVAVLRIAHLASAPGPQIQRQEAWNTLGMSFRCFLDFGTGYAGWRGAYSGGVAD